MRKIQIILLVMILIGLGLLATQKYWVDPLVQFLLKYDKGDEMVLKNDPTNISFTISDKEYRLVNGKVEKEIAPGSASKEVVRVFGLPEYGDLNGDGVKDAAMYLAQETGGSGTFYFIVLAINVDGEYKGTNAMWLGDRIAPQNIDIIDGRAVANYAERKAGEPMTTAPSVGKSVWVHFDAKNFEIGEWVKDFEGEGPKLN